jgi:hypothetical protein
MLLKDPLLQQYLGMPQTGEGSPETGRFSMSHLPGSNEGNPDWQAGAKLPGMLQRSKLFRPLGSYLNLLRTNPSTAIMGTALAGGLAGYGLGKLHNQNPKMTGLIGAAAGGLGAGVVSTSMNRRWLNSKQGSAIATSAGDLNYITQALSQDRSADSSLQSKLFGALNFLTPNQLRILTNVLKGLAGGSVAAVIAHYIVGLGGAGTMLSAAVGGAGLMGNPFGAHNAFGQRQMGSSPFGGTPFQF